MAHPKYLLDIFSMPEPKYNPRLPTLSTLDSYFS